MVPLVEWPPNCCFYRFSFLKAWSRNDPFSSLLKSTFEIGEANLCPICLERVPSQSNPVDFLSRSEVATWKGISRRVVDIREVAATLS